MYRQWKRFTLRTMLCGVAFASVILALIAVFVQKGARQRGTVAELLQYDGASVIARYGDYSYTAPPTISVDGFSFVLGRGQRLHGFSVGDRPSRIQRLLLPLLGVHALAELSAVYWDGAPVADTQLQLLARAPQLRELHLSQTIITDKGIEQIIRFQQLVVLDLSDTDTTNSGLVKLSTCSKLRELNLSGTAIDERAIERLERALPKCEITW